LTDYPGRVWVVGFHDGSVVRDFVDDNGCVRPVRSGQ